MTLLLKNKNDCLDENLSPNGISNILKVKEIYPAHIWKKGYFCVTEEGTWYEVYISDEIKKIYPSYKQLEKFIKNYSDLYIDDYEEYGQITFFEPKNEKKYTLDELSNFFS